MRKFLCLYIVILLMSQLPIAANAQGDSLLFENSENSGAVEEYMGYMSLPADTGEITLPHGTADICEVVPQGNGPFFYDVAYEATERELKGTDYRQRPQNEEAIVLAREFFNASKLYDAAVNTCMQTPNADVNYCKCRQDEERLAIQHIYGIALEKFPQWERMILKIPREDRGHQFLHINRFAPDSWAYYCGNQIE
ncbi:MAG TPA: hypothetical protein EYG18_08565 [Micavibrio sp.]|nr:hypothetical protein [Micavibrio sp.]HIL29307.1 hypothetical protein [Micavibrio sp.]